MQSYDEVTNDHRYQKVAKKARILGTWDDHDYGLDNGYHTFQHKDFMRQLFLDFLQEPKDSPRRARPGGIYESYFLDKEQKVKLIILDNRYSADGPEDDSVPEEEKSTLGSEQEKWVREEIQNSTAHFTIVAGGIQFIPDDRKQEHFFKKSLLNILSATNPKTRRPDSLQKSFSSQAMFTTEKSSQIPASSICKATSSKNTSRAVCLIQTANILTSDRCLTTKACCS